MNESETNKCTEKDKEIQDVKERLKRAEGNLVIANEMVAQRDEAIIELGKRISSLKIQDVKERLKRAEENLVIANEMVAQRDEAIIELGKRISSLNQDSSWDSDSEFLDLLVIIDEVGDEEGSAGDGISNIGKENLDPMLQSDGQDSSWDSDSEFLDLLVIIDEVGDEEGSAGDGISNIGKENLDPMLQSDGQARLTAFQKRKMTIEHKLSQLSSLIESMQKNLLSAKSELKEKSAIECDLRQSVAKLRLTIEKLKGECEQLRATAIERPISEVMKLMERLRDLETVSENAVKSAELSNNAFIRMDLRKNQYRDIISSSIDEIDQLCGILKRYVDSEHCTPEPGVNTNICVEVEGHVEVSSRTRDSKSKIALLGSAQKAIATTDIPLSATSNCVRTPSANHICTAQIDGCKIADSSFLSDCSIATLDRTCFVQTVAECLSFIFCVAVGIYLLDFSTLHYIRDQLWLFADLDTSMQPDAFKKPRQKQRVIATDSADSVSLSKQRNESGGEWLSAKRSHQRNNS
uniref:HAP1 N-terminal domain-containing protein n=1 Tax=Ascaris lumbricoides TaxID=6252 RepID=A0A0M3IPS5_ASCLU